MPRPAGPPYTALELAAWRGLLQTHAHLREQLGSALEDEYGLSISEFEVLIMVNDTDTDSLRMSALAERVLLTPSGLSRLVDRLERRGLVTRTRDDDRDGRALQVASTQAGKELFEVASRAHAGRVRTLFLGKMTHEEMQTLADVWAKVNGSPRDAYDA